MAEIAIAALLQEPIADSRSHLNQDRVAWYLGHFDEAEPVVVFDTGGDFLLADGYHRVAAAQRLGRETIAADIHRGTRADALRFAVELASQQRGWGKRQALAAIKRRSGARWGRHS